MHRGNRSGPILAVFLALAASSTEAAIEGRVAGPDGKPRRAIVRLLENPDDRWAIPRIARTGEDGRFEFDALGDAPTWIRIESPGLQPVVRKLASVTGPLDVQLETGSSLGGRVVDHRTGEGVHDATVWVCDRDAKPFGFDACAKHAADAQGRFAFNGVPALEAVRLGASSPEHAFSAIELPAVRSDNDFHLIELRNGAPLSGRVVDDQGRPREGARIGRDGKAVPFGDATEVLFDPPLITDKHGEFQHPGVAVRERQVYRGLVEGWYGVPSGWVSPVKGTSRTLELTLERPATLSLGLTFAGDLVQPPVRLIHHSVDGVSGPSAEAGPDGRYLLEGLPTRPLKLELTIEGFQPLDLGEVALGPGKTIDLGDLTVFPGVVLSGTVVDDDGHPIEDSLVELSYDTPVKSSQGQATESGAFSFAGVPPEVEVRLESSAAGFAPFRERRTLDGDTEMEITLARVASVRGRVLAPNGDPATRFIVRAIRNERGLHAEQTVDGDSDGRFFIWPIEPAGPHTLEIFAKGFKELRLPDVIIEKQRSVDVGDVRLELGHTLEGTATRPDGSPAEGGRVWVSSRSRSGDYAEIARIERLFASRADRNGNYSIAGLDPGFYIVNAQHPEFSPWTHEIQLIEDVTTETLNVEFSEGGVIHGTSRDRAGAPVADIGVAVNCPRLTAERATTTDAQGYYRLSRLPDVQCEVGAFMDDGSPFGNPKIVAVVADRESRVDFDLSNTIEVTGVVSVGGRIADRGFVTFQSNGFRGTDVAAVAVDTGTGRYRAELTEPGEYRVQVESGSARHTAKLVVGDEASIERNFDIPVNWILGRVVDADGNPLESVAVSGSNADLDLGVMLRLYTVSNSQGRFELRHLEPGTYTLTTNLEGYRPFRSAPIPISESTRIDDIELVLESALTRLRGRVIDPLGAAVPNGFVIAAATGTDRLELAANANVKRDGSFVIDAPGEGLLDITALAPGWAAARVSGVLASDDAEITLQLTFGGQIHVTVVDRNGVPLEGRQIQVRAEPGWLASQTLWLFSPAPVSGPDGIARATRMPAGTYRISTAGGTSGLVSVSEGEIAELRLIAE